MIYTPGYFADKTKTGLISFAPPAPYRVFYRTGVTLEGINYLDGGISGAIPVQEAAKRGRKRHCGDPHRTSQMYYTPQWFKRMERWLGESSLQPLVNTVRHHEAITA